ncbi:MAG: hypothetical protein ACI84K_001176 [Pseudohongiellaceae bacterium]|jgi:hypothetical protein
MSTQTLASKTIHTKTTTAQSHNFQKTSSVKKQHSSPASNSQYAKIHTVDQWVKMSRSHLDAIYKKAKAGKLPQGDTIGTAIFAGSPLPRILSSAANLLAWQGKVFDLFSPDFDSGVVINKVSPLGLNLIVAKTYRDKSWMDGKDTIVIDYSGTSLVARQIRDEIREVEPGLYLGKVWWGKTRVLDFSLETHKALK